MNGLKLTEMDASDMLDIVHFYFEEETAFISAEQAGELTRIRSRLYESLYERPYKYGEATESARHRSRGVYKPSDEDEEYETDEDDFVDLKPFDPAQPKQEHKPFVPATDFDPESEDPFNGILDVPLSH